MEYFTIDNFFKYLMAGSWCLIFASGMTAIRTKFSAYRGIKKSELEEGEYCLSCLTGILIGVIFSHFIMTNSILP